MEMTREEAIEILEEVKMLDDSIYAYNLAYGEALVMAIEMLKAQESCEDAVSRDAVMELTQSYGPATYDMPYGSGDMIIRPEDVKALPSVCPMPVARVMTLEEALHAPFAWTETRDGYMSIRRIRGIRNEPTNMTVEGFSITMAIIPKVKYGRFVRCWTSRPTDTQREATPWSTAESS